MVAINEKFCGDCDYYQEVDSNAGICRRFPPTVFPMPQPPRVVGQRSVAMGQMLLSPVVNKKRPACGEFKNGSQ